MPRKDERFTFVLDKDERRILAALARRLERSRSDAVRWLIRNAAAGNGASDPAAQRVVRAASGAAPYIRVEVYALQFNQTVNQNGGVNINTRGNATIGRSVTGRDSITTEIETKEQHPARG